MRNLEKAIKLASRVINENEETSIYELCTVIYATLAEYGLEKYYDIICDFICDVRNHLRVSGDK